jgi:adenine deaminase
VVYGDVLLDKGLIVALGYIPPNLLASAKARGGGEMKVLDVAGKWITPGLVDLHSHFSPNWLSPYGMSRFRCAKQVLIIFFQMKPLGTRTKFLS